MWFLLLLEALSGTWGDHTEPSHSSLCQQTSSHGLAAFVPGGFERCSGHPVFELVLLGHRFHMIYQLQHAGNFSCSSTRGHVWSVEAMHALANMDGHIEVGVCCMSRPGAYQAVAAVMSTVCLETRLSLCTSYMVIHKCLVHCQLLVATYWPTGILIMH